MDWRKIDGWFTDADAEAYRIIVESLPMLGGKIAEIGVWQGRSIGALIEQIRIYKRHPEIIAIDTFHGSSDNDGNQLKIVAEHGGSIYGTFIHNVSQFNYPQLSTFISDSVSLAKTWPDHSLDAIFFDGNHTQPALTADIKAWRSKIKPGGLMAGHDIDYGSVHRAIMDTLGSYETVGVGRCWISRL
jgi:hypothetical protein